MLYQIHEWQRSFLGPLSYFAQANAQMLNDNSSPLAQLPGVQRLAAGYELINRLGKDYETPEFGLHTAIAHEDRQSVGSGKSVSVRVDLGGRGILKTKKNKTHTN